MYLKPEEEVATVNPSVLLGMSFSATMHWSKEVSDRVKNKKKLH